MVISISLILICGLLEIVISYGLLFSYRRLISLILFVLLVLANGVLLYYGANRLWVIVLLYLSIYRLFNIYRIGYSKIQIEHLKHIVRKSAYRLLGFQLVILMVGALLTNVFVIHRLRWIILSSMQLLIGLVLLGSTLRHKNVTRRIRLNTPLLESNAPTLTVAIPARNETEDLYDCLLSLVACDYPKLEILVLDDNSTTRRTPEIIRSFAHDGVEFISGKPVEQGWLAKNWAYQQLLEAANGDIVMFCGVDTRFSKESLKFLVSALINRKKQMISILPKNTLMSGQINKLLQPLRYAWEICLPRRGIQRPPVLSTCWLAGRSFINDCGGFKAISRRVVCESYFARRAANNDGYSFFQYDEVISNKKPIDELETALRLRYPQLHRQPEFVALVSLLEIGGILSSLIILISALFVLAWTLIITSVLSIIVFSIVFGLACKITYRITMVGGFLSWPLAGILDIYLQHLSMWRYEFGTVLWKGRSVAPPVMLHQ